MKNNSDYEGDNRPKPHKRDTQIDKYNRSSSNKKTHPTDPANHKTSIESFSAKQRKSFILDPTST